MTADNNNTVARLASIRDRVQHGVAPADVIGDTRFLLGMIEEFAMDRFDDLTTAAAKLPPQRKRCDACGGEGERLRGNGIKGNWRMQQCEACHGAGYSTISVTP